MHEFVISAIIVPVKRILINNLGVKDLFYLSLTDNFTHTWKDYIGASWYVQV